MRVREFMTTNVITVSSKTPVAEARKIITYHKIRRLPVVDKGKVVGIVSDKALAEASPGAATSLSVWEVNYLLAKMTVGQLMKKSVVTVEQDSTAESALALAQRHGVGSLPVLDDKERLVGIVTTNDFVYRIMNPLLGIGKPGVRLHIFDCSTPQKICEVIQAIGGANLQIEAIHVDDSPERESRDLIVQINTDSPENLIHDLSKKGFKVEVRSR